MDISSILSRHVLGRVKSQQLPAHFSTTPSDSKQPEISLRQWINQLTPSSKKVTSASAIRFGQTTEPAIPTYDLVVVGAGPAGVSASVYAVRRQLKTLLLDKASRVGGYVAQTKIIENYPSHYSITGDGLAKKYKARLNELIKPNSPLASFFTLQLSKKVVKVEKLPSGEFELLINNEKNSKPEKVRTKALIIATGIVRKKVPIKGFEAYLHKGVSMCTICDGPLFKNQEVAIIGHDQAAIDAALYMAGLAKSLILLADKPINASPESVAKLKTLPSVTQILEEAKVQEIAGDTSAKSVASIRYTDKAGVEHTKPVTGVFMESDMVSSAKFVDGTMIALDDKGQVMIDPDHNAGVTGPDGLFAAGDVTTEAYKQITIAEAHGTKAALKAAEYLQGKDIKTDYGKNHLKPSKPQAVENS